MNPSPDELTQLWISRREEGKIDAGELLRKLEQRTRAFDRTILSRNLRESAGGLIVAGTFLWFALSAGHTLDLVADVWLALWGMWVAIFPHRFSRVSREPRPEQTLTAYRQALLERLDRQIRLLRSAKYWYVLPAWLGVLLHAASAFRRGGLAIGLTLAVLATVFMAFVWWLNEVKGVQYLEDKREELAAQGE